MSRRRTRPRLPSWLPLYDSINAQNLPPSTTALAGYVDGRWPSLAAAERRFPRALALSIATSSWTRAMVLDVEPGDTQGPDVVTWVEREHRHGVPRPCLYCSLDAWPEVLHNLRVAGIARNRVRFWSADWTGRPHLSVVELKAPDNEPPGATQWEGNRPPGYDISLTTAGWMYAVIGEYTRAHR